MKNIYLLFFLFITSFSFSQLDGNKTPTYPELIEYYKKLDSAHKEIEFYAMGESDYGLPIFVCIINGAQDSLKTFEKAKNETTVLINNAIHPGEPDGVNACILWIEEWIKNGKNLQNLPVIAIVPAYNVGGMMNRSTVSRANQDGPAEYGFRGNAQNLDLNRDFIKMDSKNMFTFAAIYHALNPDVFVDTHVSNGADYQYVLTLISSMKERNAPSIVEITNKYLIPQITSKLLKKKLVLFPYVELMEDTPEQGIMAFNDLARYAMGYAALFNAISFTVETHMLKPFPQRVQATKEFINELVDWTFINKTKIEKARSEAIVWQKNQTDFKFNYKLSEKKDSVSFLGYEYIYKKSEVTGQDRLFYDRTKPFKKMIPSFETYTALDSIPIPKMYGVSSEAIDVINCLKANKVEMIVLDKDTSFSGAYQMIESYKSPSKPYEGHFLHSEVKCRALEKSLIALKKGDVLIYTNQDKRQFILSVLEPKAEDSYFNWNFFDSYLSQKEHFSPYVFEEKAQEVLLNNPDLKKRFEDKKKTDAIFNSDGYAQLVYIYKNSIYFEKTFNRLPVTLFF